MTIEMKKHKRKRTYVSGAIQGRILLRFFACSVIYTCLLLSVLILRQMFANANPMPMAELFFLVCKTHTLTFFFIIAAVPILLLDVLKTTHRIAGPLVRFENTLREMRQGKPIAPIKLRDHDMLNEFCDAFNEFIEYRNQELLDSQGKVATPKRDLVVKAKNEIASIS
jgi:hypothetical protein